MFRVFGCILIFICCTSLGFIKSSSYRARTEELQGVREILRLIEMEMTYKRDSLYKVFVQVSDNRDCWLSGVLKSCSRMMKEEKPLASSWDEALRESMENCPLKEKDLETLRDLFMGLGRSDISGQKKIMEPAITKTEASLAEAAEQERKAGRMYKGLGISAGIVIAVILL